MSALSDLVMAMDPIAFAKACGVTPDPWQADVLTSDSKRLLLLAGRQTGKSTCVCLRALMAMVLEAPCEVVLISPTLQQSTELMRRLVQLYGRLPNAPKATAEALTRLRLDNGSRVLSLPGSGTSTRGYTADLIILDEAAFVPEELWTAVTPMIATKPHGRMIALTTANAKAGTFYELWTAENHWKKIKVLATECKRISQEYLDSELAALGRIRWEQEFMCIFQDNQQATFGADLIARAFSHADYNLVSF